MKNVLKIIISLFVIVGYGQIDIKDTSGFNVYVADTLYSTHKNLSNALESQLNVLRKDQSVKVEILPYGKVTAILSKDFFTGSETVIHDTVFIGQELTQTIKDTTIFGWTANLINDNKNQVSYSVFVPDQSSKAQQVKLLNYSGLDCDVCKRVPEQTVLNVKQTYEGPYLISSEQRIDDTFKILFNLVRSQDASNTYIQKYSNESWQYWKRESNSLDSIYKLPFVFQSDNPGDGTGDPGTEGTLYRHSQNHATKYWQVLAIRNKDGYALIYEVESNPLK